MRSQASHCYPQCTVSLRIAIYNAESGFALLLATQSQARRCYSQCISFLNVVFHNSGSGCALFYTRWCCIWINIYSMLCLSNTVETLHTVQTDKLFLYSNTRTPVQIVLITQKTYQPAGGFETLKSCKIWQTLTFWENVISPEQHICDLNFSSRNVLSGTLHT